MQSAGADPGIFDWGVQTLVQIGMLNFFLFIYLFIYLFLKWLIETYLQIQVM